MQRGSRGGVLSKRKRGFVFFFCCEGRDQMVFRFREKHSFTLLLQFRHLANGHYSSHAVRFPLLIPSPISNSLHKRKDHSKHPPLHPLAPQLHQNFITHHPCPVFHRSISLRPQSVPQSPTPSPPHSALTPPQNLKRLFHNQQTHSPPNQKPHLKTPGKK